MIRGISFDNQIFAANLLRMILSGYGDGILNGCDISYTGNTVTIGSGCMIAAGGAFEIVGSETITINASSGFARIKAVLDMSAEATAERFGQVSFSADTAEAISAFPALAKQEINRGGTIYEMEVCIVSLASSTVSGIVRKAGNPRAYLTRDMYGDNMPENAEEGRLYFKAVT